jgi:hypothetical protein
MYAIIHLATGIRINDKDNEEQPVFSYNNGYNPNAPEIPPKLFFKSRMAAALFIECNKFVLADDDGNAVPLIGLDGTYYEKDVLIPKYQLEIIEV